jgi:uncharacterized protein (TIGR03435 family)
MTRQNRRACHAIAFWTCFIVLGGVTSWSHAQNEGGAPDWIYGDRFDIEAQASPNTITTTSRDGKMQLNVRQMIRRLLADRFGLEMRVDRQRLLAYAMTVSSSGPRLQR